mmetsp:Transcript_1208/g.3673  ORF Transcript_1208/g.3673 Transcript_1208/m.3673 type:complete len:517 (+) Transcript_1208:387-1937(+)
MQHEDLSLAAVQCAPGLPYHVEEELHDTLLRSNLVQQTAFHGVHQLQKDVLLELETRLVEGVCENAEHVLQEREVVLLEERHIHLWRAREQPLQELREDLQATVCHLRLLVLQGPDQRVHIELQLGLRQEEECLEAMRVDCLQQVVKLGAMIRVALEIALDHIARALENHLKYHLDLLGDGVAQPCSQSREEVQHLRVSGLRHVAPVVRQHRLQQRRDEALCQLLHGEANLRGPLLCGCHVHKCLDQAQGVALDVPHQTHLGVAHDLRALLRSAVRDEVAADLVDLQHVEIDVCQLAVASGPNSTHHALVHAEDERDLPEDLLVLEHLQGAVCRTQGPYQRAPLLVEELHELGHEPLLVFRLGRADHAASGLEVGADMQVLQLRNVLRDVAHHLLHEGHLLTLLDDNKLPLALLTDLEEGVHRHVLHAWESLVHELEEFEDNCLQELPMSSQEAGVLADHVHDVAGNHSFVLLPTLHLAKAQQILDDRHEKTLLVALVHGATDRADGPAQPIQQGG